MLEGIRPGERRLVPYPTSSAITSLREEVEYARKGRTSAVLVQEADLRILLQVMRAGSELPEHFAPGRISVFVLEGELRFTAYQETQVLRPGDLISLPAKEPHAVLAVSDAAFLLTLGATTSAIASPQGRE